MKKYWKIILFSLLALVFIGMFVFLWQKSKPQPTVYEEFTPTIKDIAKWDNFIFCFPKSLLLVTSFSFRFTSLQIVQIISLYSLASVYVKQNIHI